MEMEMEKSNIYVAIMAGGIGSRFWPASREARPKQFLDILGVGKSLIRLTFERFLKLCPAENIFIVTNGIYKDLVKEHLPEISDNQILCEPSRNNTAPCVAYTSFKLHSLNPNANFVVAPSDHIILKEEAFVNSLRQALLFSETNEALLTLGIQPTRPDTGYGYINFEREDSNGVHKVIKFTEKPPLEKAQEYLKSGDYLWNAGIFIWRTQSILNAFQKYSNEIFDILKEGTSIYNTDGEQSFIDENYPKTPKISVDYAIMENAQNIYTIPADIGWSDLGTWGSLHAESAKDDFGNAVNGNKVILDNISNSLIRVPNNKLVVLKDLNDYIVVDEEDVLLIFPKSKEQEIKNITKKVHIEGGGSFL
jgi:mannose-1-phosphate guanylyltransferase